MKSPAGDVYMLFRPNATIAPFTCMFKDVPNGDMVVMNRKDLDKHFNAARKAREAGGPSSGGTADQAGEAGMKKGKTKKNGKESSRERKKKSKNTDGTFSLTDDAGTQIAPSLCDAPPTTSRSSVSNVNAMPPTSCPIQSQMSGILLESDDDELEANDLACEMSGPSVPNISSWADDDHEERSQIDEERIRDEMDLMPPMKSVLPENGNVQLLSDSDCE